MGKTTKIVIGAVVVVIVIGVGYILLSGLNNNANQNASNNNAGQGVIMGTGNPYDADHLQRTLNQGGTPGDGGGG